MRVADFDFDLPPELVAQAPPAVRGASRLLVLERSTGQITHAAFSDLPAWLRTGDLLVVNDTRVFPARLFGRRVPTGGRVEVLLIERLEEDRWDALVHPGQKLRPGGRLVLESDTGQAGVVIHGEIIGRGEFGRRTLRLLATRTHGTAVDLDEAIDLIGHVPLPPYVHRADEPADRERYQTVYARVRGSVAAPTAGLHFTPDLLHALAAAGVERVAVTLHVGYGTFKPVRTEIVEDHTVDPEHYEVSPQAAARINAAREEGRRIVAVGTTTVRTLESCGQSGRAEAGRGCTRLFIRPGHQFRQADALVTNFHLPRSSLLMLVCAFAGREAVLRAYHEAVAARYRFYSYGDAMLIV
jgi:S-adenosylmethionine:tRNA ribosyltransferase-isomerase